MNPKLRPDASGWDAKFAKAYSHPLRFRLLMTLGEGEASPNELAERFDEDLRRVDEQIKYLEREGLVELVDTDRRKGGKQHFYRALARPFLDAEEWSKLPGFAQESISAQIVRTIVTDMEAAMRSGDFDAHPHRALLQKPMIVDEQGYRDADESALRHLAELNKIAAESAGRMIASGEEGIEVKTATIIHNTSRSPRN